MKIKQIIIYVGIGLGVGILLMFFIGKGISSHWEKKYNQDIGTLTEKLKEYEKTIAVSDAAIVLNNQIIAEEKKLYEQAEAKIKEIEAANAALLAQNETLHQQITTLPDDDIVQKMGTYIGAKNVAVWLKGFTLTRIGGEKSLGLFYDKDTYFTLAKNRLDEMTKKDEQITSLNISLTASNGNFTEMENKWLGCDDALQQSLKTNTDLRRLMRWKKIENFGKGALAGGAIVFILKIVKVI